jgi:hypothetical protein
MDPNAALEEMRSIAQALVEADELDSDALTDALRLSELVQSLDEWLSKGNFLPSRWKTAR